MHPEKDFFEEEQIHLPHEEAQWQRAIEESQRRFSQQELESVPEPRLQAVLEILKEYAPWIAAVATPVILAGLYLFFRKKNQKG